MDATHLTGQSGSRGDSRLLHIDWTDRNVLKVLVLVLVLESLAEFARQYPSRLSTPRRQGQCEPGDTTQVFVGGIVPISSTAREAARLGCVYVHDEGLVLFAGRKSLKIEGRASTPSTALKRAKLHALSPLQPSLGSRTAGVARGTRCTAAHRPWHRPP